jgi:hypothetical protein
LLYDTGISGLHASLIVICEVYQILGGILADIAAEDAAALTFPPAISIHHEN